jgi:pantoate kinase
LYRLNKAKVPKKSDGFHVEVIKLSEIITTECIKEEMIKVAGDRILDPPPQYPIETSIPHHLELSLEIEKTKQLEAQEKTKQIEAQEKTKQMQMQMQMQMQVRLAELELEKMKFARQLY